MLVDKDLFTVWKKKKKIGATITKSESKPGRPPAINKDRFPYSA